MCGFSHPLKAFPLFTPYRSPSGVSTMGLLCQLPAQLSPSQTVMAYLTCTPESSLFLRLIPRNASLVSQTPGSSIAVWLRYDSKMILG
jgi:hypothetical protein